MENLDVKTIRTLVKQLTSAEIMPQREYFVGVSAPELREGVVHLGLAKMHPSSFLDLFGIMKFRKLKRDIPKKQLDEYIKTWKKNKKK